MNKMAIYAASAVIGVGAAMAVENDLHKTFMGTISNSYAQEVPSSKSEMINMLVDPVSKHTILARDPQLGRDDYRRYATCLVNEANEYVDGGNTMRYMDGSRLSLTDYYELLYMYISDPRNPIDHMTEFQLKDTYLNILSYCHEYAYTSNVKLMTIRDADETMRAVFGFEER